MLKFWAAMAISATADATSKGLKLRNQKELILAQAFQKYDSASASS